MRLAVRHSPIAAALCVLCAAACVTPPTPEGGAPGAAPAPASAPSGATPSRADTVGVATAAPPAAASPAPQPAAAPASAPTAVPTPSIAPQPTQAMPTQAMPTQAMPTPASSQPAPSAAALPATASVAVAAPDDTKKKSKRRKSKRDAKPAADSIAPAARVPLPEEAVADSALDAVDRVAAVVNAAALHAHAARTLGLTPARAPLAAARDSVRLVAAYVDVALRHGDWLGAHTVPIGDETNAVRRPQYGDYWTRGRAQLVAARAGAAWAAAVADSAIACTSSACATRRGRSLERQLDAAAKAARNAGPLVRIAFRQVRVLAPASPAAPAPGSPPAERR